MAETTEHALAPDVRATTGASTSPVLDGPVQVRLVHDVLNTLDRMVNASMEERVAVVAAGVAQGVGAAAWRVSRVDDDVVRSRRAEVIRCSAVPAGSEPLERALPYPLAGRPSIAEAAEGSAFCVTSVRGGVVERRVLEATGFTSAAVAGGYDPDARRWLLEILGDELTHEAHSFAALLFALVQAALGFPRPGTPQRTAG